MRFAWFRKLVLPKKQSKGFPSFISKTDETRIQNLPFLLKKKDLIFVGREKVDGQSGTFFLKREKKRFPWQKKAFDFGVCSRNNRLLTPDSSSYWSVARRYQIKDALLGLIGDHEWVAIQGECVAPKVQGNKYKVDKPDLYCFNLIYPSGMVPCEEAEIMVGEYGLKWVPMVYKAYTLPDSVEQVLQDATGKSKLYDTAREGVVFRNYKHGISFKAVSPDFLIQHDE
jgi:RNA ligase (TIGR02306 family)